MTTFQPVYDTTISPYRTVVKIVATKADGSRSIGSGAVVGRNDVLTASHVVDDAVSIEVIPGYDDGYRPFGTYTSKYKNYFSLNFDDGVSRSETEYDYALLTVDSPKPIGDVTGWFGLASNRLSTSQYITVNQAGYPAGYESEILAYGTYDALERDGLLYGLSNSDEFKGMSGGPIWVYSNGERHVVGIQSNSGNYQTYIDTEAFEDISEWMRSNDRGAIAAKSIAEKLAKLGIDINAVSKSGRDNNLVTGSTGGDTIPANSAGDGNVTSGEDLVFGLAGNDRIKSRSGDDFVFGNEGNDRVYGGSGNDRVYGGDGSDRLYGGSGNDRVYGNSGKDKLYGGSGQDKLYGGSSKDKLYGGTSKDKLYGGSGNDELTGNKGADLLVGGTGSDDFNFRKVSDSTRKSMDTIDGFGGAGRRGGDQIDVSKIDAMKGKKGNQKFDFDESKGKGDLWAENDGRDTMIYGNIDNDKYAEIQIRIEDGRNTSAEDYFANDFIL